MQSGGVLGKLLESLMKCCLPLMKNVLMLLAKGVVVPLELIAVALAADAGTQKKSKSLEQQH